MFEVSKPTSAVSQIFNKTYFQNFRILNKNPTYNDETEKSQTKIQKLENVKEKIIQKLKDPNLLERSSYEEMLNDINEELHDSEVNSSSIDTIKSINGEPSLLGRVHLDKRNIIPYLLKVFNVQKFSSHLFHDIINIALVYINVKPGTLTKKMHTNLQKKLKNDIGLHIYNFSQNRKPYTFISKKKLGSLDTHKQVGRELGYLYPCDIENVHNKTFVHLELKFFGRNTVVNIENQIIPIGFSEDKVINYLKKYIKGIRRLSFPVEYTLEKIYIYIDDEKFEI